MAPDGISCHWEYLIIEWINIMKVLYNIVVYVIIAMAVVFIFYVVLLLMITISLIYGVKKNNNINDPTFRKEVNEVLQLNFPSTIQWLGAVGHYEYEETITYFYGTFTIPSEDIKTVFPDDKFTWKTSGRRVTNSNGNKERWFNPDSIENFKSFQTWYPDERNVLNVLTEKDFDEKKLIKVYIVWWSHR
jgi:hypothetical protein